MVAEFVANAAKVIGKTVADIVGDIWNEWKSKVGKFSCSSNVL